MNTLTTTLKRTGKAPLEFQGDRIAVASDNIESDLRWHCLHLYRTVDDRWVGQITYQSTWDKEYPHHEAEVFDSPNQVRAFFENHNPTYYVRGFPPSPAYAERQRQLLQDIAARYRNLVTELMEKAGFVERV